MPTPSTLDIRCTGPDLTLQRRSVPGLSIDLNLKNIDSLSRESDKATLLPQADSGPGFILETGLMMDQYIFS